MSVIDRTIVLNPVEPSPVSMKLRTGLDNKVNFTYLRQNGAPYNVDFGAQLYLVGRTRGNVLRYLITSTDVVNGKARAYIPADDVTDLNGYNLQILGTVDAESRVIARGSASVIHTEGLGEIPVDLVSLVNLVFAYNEPVTMTVNLWKDAGKSVGFDIASSIITGTIYDASGGNVLANFTVTPVDSDSVQLTLTAEQVNLLPPNCWWTLTISSASGMTTLVQGNISITGAPVP